MRCIWNLYEDVVTAASPTRARTTRDPGVFVRQKDCRDEARPGGQRGGALLPAVTQEPKDFLPRRWVVERTSSWL
jgi:hypothetical protein